MPTVRVDGQIGHLTPAHGPAVVADPLGVRARLDELKRLRHGWLNGKGLPLDAAALDDLADRFDEWYPTDLPRPYIYPTAEGGVRAEWSAGGHEVSLDITLGSLRANWHALDLTTDADTERVLLLDSAPDWRWAATELRRMTGAAT